MKKIWIDTTHGVFHCGISYKCPLFCSDNILLTTFFSLNVNQSIKYNKYSIKYNEY